MKVNLLSILICLLLFSCARGYESCDYNEIEIYAIGLNILAPIVNLEKDIRTNEVTAKIIDKNDIDKFRMIIHSLKKIDENFEGMDVRIVMDLRCSDFGKTTILVNRNLVKIDDKYYENTPDFLDFLTNQLTVIREK